MFLENTSKPSKASGWKLKQKKHLLFLSAHQSPSGGDWIKLLLMPIHNAAGDWSPICLNKPESYSVLSLIWGIRSKIYFISKECRRKVNELIFSLHLVHKTVFFYLHYTTSELQICLVPSLPTVSSCQEKKKLLCINIFFKRPEQSSKLKTRDILVHRRLISRIVVLEYHSVADCWGFPCVSLHVGSNSDRRKSKQELAIEM